VISRQSLELSQFDLKLARFGGTLVSDGKDDVCKDHLLNYITVCPDGFRWELSKDVTGLRRKSEWVAEDLLQELGALEAELQAKIEVVLERAEAEYEAERQALQMNRAEIYMMVLTGDGNKMYVQIVTDTPSVNAKAWRLIEDKIPHLLANPCIFHCLNLYFVHIIKGDKSDRSNPMEPVAVCQEAEAWTKVLEQWFTNKETPRSCLLVACRELFGSKGPKRMRKYSDTRAAIAFKVWHRTLRLKVCLRQAVCSNPYVLWEDD
jgi:hypothetical protein